MSGADRLPGFVRLKSFERAATGLLTDADERALEGQLIQNPEIGAVMVGTGGVRKMRFARQREGKSGGTRVIYYYRSRIGRVYLLTVYAKSERDNLSKEERNEMKRLTTVLDRET